MSCRSSLADANSVFGALSVSVTGSRPPRPSDGDPSATSSWALASSQVLCG